MRAFKFFFGLTVALILFSFVAKIFLIAFVVAAVLSAITFFVRKLRGFSRPRYGVDYGNDYRYERNFPRWERYNEELVPNYSRNRNYDNLSDEYYIEVK